MASTYLQRTMGTPTSRKKFTISVWVKKSKSGSSNAQHIWNGYYSTDNRLVIYFQASGADTLGLYNVVGGSATGFLLTNRKFRDTNGWYHIYYAVDTTQSTASDRIKLYVNGVQETSFSNNTYPSQNADLGYANGYTNFIGKYGGDTSSQFDGAMSHFYYVDGSVIDIAQFGSTDSTTGEWKINTSPTISSYGTNGFLILKDGNTITDQSPNSNNFTASGTLTKTEDNPSNTFCTLNALTSLSHASLEHGNCSLSNSGTDGDRIMGTIPSKAGYYEFKINYTPNGSTGIGVQWGCFDITNYNEETHNINSARLMRTGYGYDTHFATANFGGGNSWENVTTGLDVDTGDILMCAWKNGKVYYGYNGTWFFSADPSNNTDGSTQIPLADSNAYQMPILKDDVGGSGDCQFNFGNGFFGTNAITSNSGNGYQDANGQGKFQYQPPTGCYALCTKNLNV